MMPSHCAGNLFEQEPDRHEVVLHTCAKNLFGLGEDAGI